MDLLRRWREATTLNRILLAFCIIIGMGVWFGILGIGVSLGSVIGDWIYPPAEGSSNPIPYLARYTAIIGVFVGIIFVGIIARQSK